MISNGPDPLVATEAVSRRFAPRRSLGTRIAGALGVARPSRTVHAVDGVSLTIARGEVLGLVGESGCGKSTLGRLVAGILPPSEGRALLDGAPVMAGRPPRKRTTRVQTVFQNPYASLDPRVPVGRQIAEGPLAHGLVTRREAGATVAGWLARVGLDPALAGRYPHQFSGGQRQRVAIARALAMRPDVLVCDEPLASLDVSIQAQIINLFLGLKRDLGLTMLFISHDLGAVRHLCDRVAIMYLGRIVETGPAAALYARPQHPYTRALLESVPRLAPDEAADFRPIAGELPSPLAPPPGCHFHPRCTIAVPPCRSERPALRPIAEGIDAACHRAPTDALFPSVRAG